MEITVRRTYLNDRTIGVFKCGDLVLSCLEPSINNVSHPCIPEGKYRVDMTRISPSYKDRNWAKEFGGIVPWLRDVPGREYILIHVGNIPTESKGCLLIASGIDRFWRGTDSVKAYKAMMRLLLSSKEEITINIHS